MAIRLFEEASHASIYRQYRPQYPQKVVEIISDYIKRFSGNFNLAVDVGCGSGQSTFYLKNAFQRCVGVDISSAQVHEANEALREDGGPNTVEFVQGSADSLPMEPSSVDLVTIAQAWHWIDPERLYSECKRVLAPGGCLAVYCYDNGQIHNKECNALVKDFYTKTRKMGVWNERRRHIDNEYVEVELPLRNTERHKTSILFKTTLNGYVGYISTWSGYCRYCELNPGNQELKTLKEKMKCILVREEKNLTDQECPMVDGSLNPSMDITFPVFIMLGQK